ncbi:hypothetical protein [Bacillus paranthracis]
MAKKIGVTRQAVYKVKL